MILRCIWHKQALTGWFSQHPLYPFAMSPRLFHRVSGCSCCYIRCLLPSEQLYPVTSKPFRSRFKILYRSLSTSRKYDEEFLQSRIHAAHVTTLFCGFALFAMYYILWYFKKRKFERTVEALPPPIDWEDFSVRFIAKDLVKELTYRPDFCVVDVYLRLTEDEIKKKRKEDKRLSIIPIPEHALKPDLRFWFGGSEKELKNNVENALLDAGITRDIALYIDSFPDRIEIAFMILSLIFCACFLFSSLKNKRMNKFFRRPP